LGPLEKIFKMGEAGVGLRLRFTAPRWNRILKDEIEACLW